MLEVQQIFIFSEKIQILKSEVAKYDSVNSINERSDCDNLESVNTAEHHRVSGWCKVFVACITESITNLDNLNYVNVVLSQAGFWYRFSLKNCYTGPNLIKVLGAYLGA